MPSTRFVPSTAGIGFAVSLALASVATAEPASPTAADEAARRLTELERVLLEAPAVELDFAVTAAGAVSADLSGSLSLRDDRLTLDAAGTFDGREVQLAIRTTPSGRLVGGPESPGDDAPGFDVERPPYLREAVVLGFTRMGILHNLAVLGGGAPPDHSAEGIGDWLRLDDITISETKAGAVGVVFDLAVAGQPAAEDIQLWIDDAGRPTLRHQTVRFPEGEMRVVETYSNVSFGD